MDQTNTILILMYTALASMILGIAIVVIVAIFDDRQKRRKKAIQEKYS